eukprot:CAMPEP_0118930472 /NCGR_PEP_ID=MMETSP1169-20130426/7149_1 /TAXON_ID=36882 /ORGANISM="Pyramimonas obovata, Strain CCMP722" /LENGTH=320 /DNA_ID=CAMNT_0006872833 /DNA_START=110 /DNA_END=1073 /DNA_ORIENTATION=-
MQVHGLSDNPHTLLIMYNAQIIHGSLKRGVCGNRLDLVPSSAVVLKGLTASGGHHLAERLDGHDPEGLLNAKAGLVDPEDDKGDDGHHVHRAPPQHPPQREREPDEEEEDGAAGVAGVGEGDGGGDEPLAAPQHPIQLLQLAIQPVRHVVGDLALARRHHLRQLLQGEERGLALAEESDGLSRPQQLRHRNLGVVVGPHPRLQQPRECGDVRDGPFANCVGGQVDHRQSHKLAAVEYQLPQQQARLQETPVQEFVLKTRRREMKAPSMLNGKGLQVKAYWGNFVLNVQTTAAQSEMQAMFTPVRHRHVLLPVIMDTTLLK